MFKRLLLLCAWLPMLAVPAAAQTTTAIQLVSSSPADGADEVPLTTTVSLTFNQPIPENEDLGDYIEIEGTFDESFDPENIFYEYSADRRTVSAEFVHAPNEDYFIYALPQVVLDECTQTTFEVEPFVVHYTTATSIGTAEVSGTVTLGDDVVAGKTALTVPAQLREQSAFFRSGLRRSDDSAETAALIEGEMARAKEMCALAQTGGSAAGKAAAVTVENTAIALFPVDNPDSLAGIAFADANGNYAVEHVRPGTYYALAINFGGLAGVDTEEILFDLGISGTYDANADGEPDPITVNGNMADVDITLHLSSFFSVSQEEAEAKARAAAEAETGLTDLELVSVATFGSDLSGEATSWSFTYYSPSEDVLVYSEREFFFYSVETDFPSGDEVPFPADGVTAAEALAAIQADATAQTFFTENAGASFFVMLVGGPPQTFTEEGGGDPVWTATIYAFSETTGETQFLSGVVDVATGAVLQVQTFPGVAEDYVDFAESLVTPLHGGAQPPVLYRIASTSVNPETGESAFWNYDYEVDFGGLAGGASAFVTPTGSFAFPSFTAPDSSVSEIPATRISSEQALAIAEDEGGAAFRQEYAALDQYVNVDIEGGYARDLMSFYPSIVTAHPEIETTPVWAITYTTNNGTPCVESTESDSFIVVLNMQTGAIIAIAGSPVANETEDRAGALALRAAYPNPFRGQTQIDFTLAKSGRVAVGVYNLLGQRVATLAEGVRGAGPQSVTWRADGLPSGVYFVRLEAEGRTLTRTVVLQR